MDASESSAGIRPKKQRSRMPKTVRTGCTTRPSEKAMRAASMASINSPIGSAARTSDSESQSGIVGHFSSVPEGVRYFVLDSRSVGNEWITCWSNKTPVHHQGAVCDRAEGPRPSGRCCETSGLSGSNQAHVRVHRKSAQPLADLAQALAHQGVVIGDQNPNRWHGKPLCRPMAR